MRVILATVAMLVSAGTARAEPVYALDLALDVPVLAVSAVIAAGFTLRSQLAPAHCAPRCDPSELWAIDRGSAGLYDEGWSTVSDAGVALVLAGAAATVIAGEGLADGAADALVVAEAVLVANALGVLTTNAFGRPRPYVYGSRAPLERRLDGDSALSFYSGHTAGAFAATLAVFQTLRRSEPDSPLPWIALGAGVLASSTIGLSRVLSGEHFPTDVLAGALIGAAIGFAVPALHDPARGVSVGPGGVALRAAF